MPRSTLPAKGDDTRPHILQRKRWAQEAEQAAAAKRTPGRNLTAPLIASSDLLLDRFAELSQRHAQLSASLREAIQNASAAMNETAADRSAHQSDGGLHLVTLQNLLDQLRLALRQHGTAADRTEA